MSRCMLLLVALLILAVGCGRSDRNVAMRSAVDLENLSIGEPIRHGNLTIFPVVSKTAQNENPFITLDEGLKAGTIEIREVGSATAPNEPGQSEAAASAAEDNSGSDTPANELAQASTPNGNARQAPAAQPPVDNPFAPPRGNRQTTGGSDVNRLLVLNKSNKPLYLMPGEIIVGGQQDRVIGSEVVIQPSEQAQTIDVFCVEHGRWHNRTAAELASNISTQTWSEGRAASNPYPVADLVVPVTPEASNPEKAAEQAAQGKFIASVGNVSKASRLVVQESADQGKVWDEVAKQNDKSGVAGQAATGAFTKNYADEDTLKKLEPLIVKMKDPVAGTKNIVGVIVAVDGKIDSMDVFQSTPLFRQLWPKLLKSYALDAVNAQDSADEPEKAKLADCTKADAEQFLTKAFKSGEESTETKSNVAVTTRRAEDVISFTAGAESGLGGSGGGGFGGVHTSAFSK
jgi:hypothetical protein